MAELVLQLLPVSTATKRGYHHDPDMLTYPANHRWRVATGWDLRNPQSLRSNSWGFAAEREFVRDPAAVALIGDSYVEASMLATGDRPAPQLEGLLGSGRPVYAMGSPGTSLIDYAHRIRMADTHFGVRDVVLMVERFDARQSLCGSGNVQAHCLDPGTLERRVQRESPPGLLKSMGRRSALAQYVSGQIRVRPRSIMQAMWARTTPEVERATGAAASTRAAPTEAEVQHMRHMVDAVVQAFIADARPHLKGRLIVVVDGRRDGSSLSGDLADLERTYLIERLRDCGAVVHDLEPLFTDHVHRSGRRLDVGPYDGHLNPIGVRIAMTQAALSLAALD